MQDMLGFEPEGAMRIAGVLLVVLCAGCSPAAASPEGDAPLANTEIQITSHVSSVRTWRALLVAGDRGEHVFDHAVRKLAELLGKYGVADIAVLSAKAAIDVASLDNMRQSLANTDADAGCFVFVTSHGLREGLLLRGPKQEILTPRLLDAMLDDSCGDVPTIVIASGCYSGVFVGPVMLAQNRIILTAAHKRRTSFGCTNDRDLTFYDSCLLRSLDGATLWAKIARDTERCVRRLETRHDFTPSQPQEFFGTAVRDLSVFGRAEEEPAN